MKNKFNKFLSSLVDKLWKAFITYTLVCSIVACLLIILIIPNIPLQRVVLGSLALGSLMGIMATVMLSQLRNSMKFWKLFEDVDARVENATTTEELEAIYGREFKTLRKLQMGHPHSSELNRLYAVMKTKVKFLPTVLTEEQEKQAQIFYIEHKEHIDKMVSATTASYAPSEAEDKNDPRIWKPEYWKWFLWYNVF